MELKAEIRINGERRSEIALRAEQPIPDLEKLALRWKERRWFPGFVSGPENYADGAYRFHLLSLTPAQPGTHHAESVSISYTDGSRVEVPLQDSIVLEIPAIPKTAEHRPKFSAQ